MSSTQRRRFTVKWESYSVAGNPRVNPGPADQNRVVCSGWTPVLAHTEQEVVDQWEQCFPGDRIVAIN